MRLTHRCGGLGQRDEEEEKVSEQRKRTLKTTKGGGDDRNQTAVRSGKRRGKSSNSLELLKGTAFPLVSKVRRPVRSGFGLVICLVPVVVRSSGDALTILGPCGQDGSNSVQIRRGTGVSNSWCERTSK